MNVKVKLNFQISIPNNIDINGANISLINIKPHFMTQEFYLSFDASIGYFNNIVLILI